MTKICKSCGMEYSGDFCEHCGYGKEPERAKAYDKYKSNRQRKSEKEAAASKPEKNGQAKKGGVSGGQIGVIIGIAILTVGVMVWSLWRDGVIGAGDKTGPIVSYFEAIAENDYEKYVNTMPEAIAETYDDYMSANGLSEDTFIRESYADYTEIFGQGFTAAVSCGDEEKMDAAEIDDAEQLYEQNFGEQISIKEAYKVSTKVDFSGSERSETYYYDVYVAKIGFHWYILNIDDYYDTQKQ